MIPKATIGKGAFFIICFTVLAAGALAGFHFLPTIQRHLAIDRCLDAGGAFDARQDLCRFTPQPQVELQAARNTPRP